MSKPKAKSNLALAVAAIIVIVAVVAVTWQRVQPDISTTSQQTEPALKTYSSDSVGVSFAYPATFSVYGEPEADSALSPAVPSVFVGFAEYEIQFRRYPNVTMATIAKRKEVEANKLIIPGKETLRIYAMQLRDTRKEKFQQTIRELDAKLQAGEYNVFRPTTFQQYSALTGDLVTEYSEYYVDNYSVHTFILIQDEADVIEIRYPKNSPEAGLAIVSSVQIQ